MRDLILFLFLALCVSSLVVGQTQSRASYGEACSRFHRCDSKASLSCEDGTCECVMADKMIFDEGLGKCVTIVGERCIYTAAKMTGDSLEEVEARRYSEQLPCVPNAVCTNEFCVCINGYFETINGTCERKHTYGETCYMNDNCREGDHLVCNSSNGTCDCNDQTAYDSALQKCVGRVGSLCKDHPTCVPNAQCPPKKVERREEYRNYRYQIVEKTLDYTTETCACKSGYSPSVTMDSCFAKHGESCVFNDPSRRCLAGLICREGTCSCPYEDHQFYDSSIGKCRSRIGGPCSNDTTACIKHSECVNGYCQCGSGFIEVNRKCELAFGEKCESDMPSVRRFPLGVKCDSIAPLHCIQGICQCSSLEYYEHSKRSCRGLEGAKCSLKNPTYCMDGAFCNTFRNVTSLEGTCTCMEGFQSFGDRKCELAMSTTLSPLITGPHIHDEVHTAIQEVTPGKLVLQTTPGPEIDVSLLEVGSNETDRNEIEPVEAPNSQDQDPISISLESLGSWDEAD